MHTAADILNNAVQDAARLHMLRKKAQEKSREYHNHNTMKLSTKELLVEFVAQSIAIGIASFQKVLK